MGRDDIAEFGKNTQFSSTNQPANSGRKPKSFKMFNDKMKEQGYEPLTKNELINCYALIFSAEQNKIQEIANDEEQPLALRLIIQELTDERTRSMALKDFRDYMFGKANEKVDLTTNGESINQINPKEIMDNITNILNGGAIPKQGE